MSDLNTPGELCWRKDHTQLCVSGLSCLIGILLKMLCPPTSAGKQEQECWSSHCWKVAFPLTFSLQFTLVFLSSSYDFLFLLRRSIQSLSLWGYDSPQLALYRL